MPPGQSYRYAEGSSNYKTSRKDAEEMASEDAKVQKAQRAAGELATEAKAETDALLDEIDTVLETNAAEFVKAYVQKGGE